MPISMTPRKSADRQRIKEFLNAEHGKDNLTPDEVKNILNYDIYKVIAELEYQENQEDSVLKESAEVFSEYCTRHLDDIMKTWQSEIVNTYRNSNLMVNRDVIEYAKDIMSFLAQKNIGFERKLDPRINELNLCIKAKISVATTFNRNDIEIIKMIYKSNYLHVTEISNMNYAIIDIWIRSLAKPIPKNGGE